MAEFGCRRWVARATNAVFAFAFLVVAAGSQNRPETSQLPSSSASPPYWAYAVNPPSATPDAEAKPADPTPLHVPNSTASFTRAQVGDLFSAPDWHPAGHPAMPEVVAHGSKPGVYACGYCHLPNGQGRPENSSLAGLPTNYIVQQVADFKTGRRRSSQPALAPVTHMIEVAMHSDETQIRTAAAYFSGLKPKQWIRVVETSTVPRTHVAGWMLVASDAGGREPIGHRIIEMPEDLDRTELRDDASGFVAFVPPGSVQKGKTLVRTGGAGKTVPCSTCHGTHLTGKGDVPSIAGRSPSYIVRQLYDIQHGTRSGAAADAMKGPVAKLTLDDMVSIAAYAASLNPR